MDETVLSTPAEQVVIDLQKQLEEVNSLHATKRELIYNIKNSKVTEKEVNRTVESITVKIQGKSCFAKGTFESVKKDDSDLNRLNEETHMSRDFLTHLQEELLTLLTQYEVSVKECAARFRSGPAEYALKKISGDVSATTDKLQDLILKEEDILPEIEGMEDKLMTPATVLLQTLNAPPQEASHKAIQKMISTLSSSIETVLERNEDVKREIDSLKKEEQSLD